VSPAVLDKHPQIAYSSTIITRLARFPVTRNECVKDDAASHVQARFVQRNGAAHGFVLMLWGLRMQFHVGESVVDLVQGDITREDVDAIVNAANSSLLGGGGVDGAIHRAAGPELLAETRTLGGCPTGEARITKGYRLKARHVIHAVGPVYHGRPQDAELLASAYRTSMELAAQHHLTSVAFPAISTGVYGYPLDEAAPIALATVKAFLEQHPEIRLVRFVLFDRQAYAAFERAAQQLLQ
jgi:O-acetyl-ADP-ribose deacetylase (regulator of RNase III)